MSKVVKPTFKTALSVQKMTADAYPAEVQKAIAMHNQTIAASNSFHSLFCERQAGGKTSEDHHEQDLLRAMLLFASSGLDAAIKQLVRDGLQAVIARDPGAQRQFAKFIERRLKRGPDEPDRSSANFDYTFLSSALASPDPRSIFLESLIGNLTNDSLQSRDQILKVASHFAVTKDEVLSSENVTNEAFKARNQLAHEMDIDFYAEHKRRDRSYNDMVKWSENILGLCGAFIAEVSKRIPENDDATTEVENLELE